MSNNVKINRKALSTLTACKIDDSIWVSCALFNGLCSYNTKTGQVLFESEFIDEGIEPWRLYGKSIAYKSDIYFIPDRAQNIQIYNLTEKKMQVVEINEKGRIGCVNALFYNENIYFLTKCSEKKLCILNVIDKKLTKMVLPQYCQKLTFCSDMVVINNRIFFASIDSGDIVIYDIFSQKFEKKFVMNTDGFSTITYDGKNIWFSDKNGIYRWSESGNEILSLDYPAGFGMVVLDKGEIKTCEGFVDWSCNGERPFSFSIYRNNKVWLFPVRTNMIVQIEVNTCMVSQVECALEDEDEKSLYNRERVTHRHYLNGQDEDGCIFISTKSNIIYEWNFEQELVSRKSYSIEVDEKELAQFYMDSFVRNNQVMHEGMNVKLTDLIGKICS